MKKLFNTSSKAGIQLFQARETNFFFDEKQLFTTSKVRRTERFFNNFTNLTMKTK